MDWFLPLDLYCERTALGLWNEPLNALSNLAFPLAAWLAWREAGTRGMRRPVVAVLCVLAALIGLGSGLFHSFANRWSEWADVVPIWTFVGLYVLTSIALLTGAPPRRVARIAVIAAAITVVVVLATSSDADATGAVDPLNGSGQYLPALAALGVFAAVTQWRRHPIRRWALAAALTFVLSLLFRTFDLHLCEMLPMGTHFMWHLLNAVMLWLLLIGLIRTAPSRL